MTNVTFQSKIRLVKNSNFNNATKNINKKYFIDYPWGLKNSVIGKQAYTTNVFDCTVCGIKDKEKILMLHISPDSNDGYDFPKIEKFITQNINLKTPNLSAFLIGSKMGFDVFERSEKLFDNFRDFMKKNKIQFSELRGGVGGKDIAFDVNKDELLIGTPLIEKENIKTNQVDIIDFARHAFEEIKISDKDEISW